MTQTFKPEEEYTIDTTCDLGDCVAVFGIWDGDDVRLISVQAKNDETGEFECVHVGEELNRWRGQLEDQAHKDFVIKLFRG